MKLNINFASREYIFVRRVYIVLISGVLLCAAAIAAGYHGYQKDVAETARLEQEIKSAREELAMTEKDLEYYARTLSAETVSRAYNEASFANTAISRRVFSWTTFLNRIEVLVPPGIGITAIKPEFSSLNVDLSGTASDMSTLTDFIGALARSEYFGDIPPTFSASEGDVDTVSGKTLWSFRLKIKYIPEPARDGVGSTREGG